MACTSYIFAETRTQFCTAIDSRQYTFWIMLISYIRQPYVGRRDKDKTMQCRSRMQSFQFLHASFSLLRAEVTLQYIRFLWILDQWFNLFPQIESIVKKYIKTKIKWIIMRINEQQQHKFQSLLFAIVRMLFVYYSRSASVSVWFHVLCVFMEL